MSLPLVHIMDDEYTYLFIVQVPHIARTIVTNVNPLADSPDFGNIFPTIGHVF